MDKVPSIFNNLRPLTIGFDDVFDHFESLLDDDYRVTSSRINYPPYDIRKVGDNKFNIEAALAGFNKNDIEVLTKDNTLTIKTKKEKTFKSFQTFKRPPAALSHGIVLTNYSVLSVQIPCFVRARTLRIPCLTNY